VIAGDNLFDFSLPDFVSFWSGKGVASAVAVRDVGSLELATQYGIVELDDEGRMIDFVEKPADPPSTLAATATYLYRREHAALVGTYLAEGNNPDQPGRFVQWLHKRIDIFTYPIDGLWYDIGSQESLAEANEVFSGR